MPRPIPLPSGEPKPDIAGTLVRGVTGVLGKIVGNLVGDKKEDENTAETELAGKNADEPPSLDQEAVAVVESGDDESTAGTGAETGYAAPDDFQEPNVLPAETKKSADTLGTDGGLKEPKDNTTIPKVSLSDFAILSTIR